MSTRYVWEKYGLVAQRPAPKKVTSHKFAGDNSREAWAASGYTITKGETRYRYSYTGSTKALNPGSGFISYAETKTYPYIVDPAGTYAVNQQILLENINGAYWQPATDGTIYCDTAISGDNHVQFNLYEGFNYTQGSLLSKVAGSSRNAYADGPSIPSGLYYVYLGEDTLDPTSLTYSTDEIKSGEPVTLTAHPVSPTYGGTVYYQFAYSTNGGQTWTNVGAKSTDAAKTITVPSGISQFQARVQASDDLGFTSADYVFGPLMTVVSMQAWVGVNGKARAIEKIYVGVNGKAREVTAGYIGVGGKARKFL